jgi:vancomycin resistance protein YoaR
MVRVKHSGPTITTQAYLIGRQGDMLTRAKEKLQILLSLKKFVFTTHLEYDDVLYRESLDLLAKQYDIVPKNALFELENGKVKTFAKETEGLRIDTTKALSQIRHAWTSRVSHASNDPIVIDIESHTVTPDITLENSSVHGIKEIIGEGTSDYTHSIPGRIHNLLLASDKLHGILIPKGATFSYNEAIGEISARTGYQPAYVIVNGRTELGDGGGVCQTSTTIFRAALNSGLPITEWHAHAYRVGYYENDSKPGRDATIYTPSVDLKFTNDTAASILIQVQKDLAHNKLTYRFWGTKDDRNITISDVSTSGALPAPPPRYQDDPTLAKGIIKQVDWAASGLTAWFDYHVTRADGSLIQKKTFTSVYRPWQAVYLVGTRE